MWIYKGKLVVFEKTHKYYVYAREARPKKIGVFGKNFDEKRRPPKIHDFLCEKRRPPKNSDFEILMKISDPHFPNLKGGAIILNWAVALEGKGCQKS